MIFTGIEILFFSLGALTSIFMCSLIYYKKKYTLSSLVLSLFVSGGALAIFCIAWSVSSYLEGVPRAASMGLAVFGIPSIIILLLARRMALKTIKK